MSVNGAQIRLIHEYIHANTGQWITSTSSWMDANPGQLQSIQDSVSKQIHRADRRMYRIEYRRFSVQVHTIDMHTSWPTLNEIIEKGHDNQPDQWVLVVGNPDDGFTLTGPFPTSEEASAQGSRDACEEWWTMRMYPR